MSFICPCWVRLTTGKWLPFGNFPILYSFSENVWYGTFIWGHTGMIRNRAGRLSSGCELPSTEYRHAGCRSAAASAVFPYMFIYEVYNDRQVNRKICRGRV